MRYALAIILFCAACAFSQERVIDTIYTDTHKVTYVIDTLNSSDNNSSANNAASAPESKTVSKAEEVDTLGMSAPPNKLNKISLFLIAQNLSFIFQALDDPNLQEEAFQALSMYGKKIFPPVTFPGNLTRPMIARAVILFPQPDSPTMPTIFPAGTVSVTPFTGRMTPFSV